MAEHHDPTPMGHVQDEAGHWVLFHDLFGGITVPLGPVDDKGNPIPLFTVAGHEVFFTKFMLLELIAAILVIAIFVPLARRAAAGGLPKGPFWNAFESLLTFVRNDIAKPTLGEEDADTYVPFLWTIFLFILFCNLLGMIPTMGSPTASIWVTGGLALISFAMLHGAAVVKMGPMNYLKSLWPHIEIVPNPWRRPGDDGHGHGHDHAHAGHGHGHTHAEVAHHHHHEEPLPKPTTGEIVTWLAGSTFGFVLTLMIFLIEVFGTGIKSGVLAVRLFANMFGGHMVLATIIFFIYLVGNASASYFLWGGVTFASVLGVVALSLLELFVAFLQAYVFTFLTSLFMGMALHPSH